MRSHAAKGIFAILVVAAWHAGAARIESFSPTGYTKDVVQVAVRFSEPMVALGDPGIADPFVVECGVPGNGRWVDERNWVYDFAYDVPSAERCRFSLRRGVRTLAGARLTGPREHVFHTGGPNIIYGPIESSYTWPPRIDERQVFLMALDAVADEDSIRQHAYCRIGGSRRVAVEVVTGAERDEIIDALVARTGTIKRLVDSAATHLPRYDAATLRERALRRVVAVRCRETLPNDEGLSLVWGAGVASLDGPANPRDEVHAFSVRRAFTASVRCSPRLDDVCVGSIRVEFSAPVERDVAKLVRLFDADGINLPTVVADSPYVEDVEFEGTVAEDSSYRVELAPGATGPLVDIDGRVLANEDDYPAVVQIGTPPTSGTFGHGTMVVPPGPDATAPAVFYRPGPTLRGRRLAVTDDHDLSRWLQEFEDAREGRGNRWGGYESPLLGENGRGTPFELTFNQQAGAFQTAAVPLGGQGLEILELELPPTASIPNTRYVLGKAIATALDVHFKLGRESSLVWVTGFTDGRPVADAALRLTDGCTGASLWRGRSDADGLARVAALPDVDGCSRPHYLVSARKDSDQGFVAIPIELPSDAWSGAQFGEKNNLSLKAHTIVDRSLLQPGDTVSMKHVLRLATSDGFALPRASMRSVRLSIDHGVLGEVHAEDIALDETGTATSTFDVPEDASLGHYDIKLRVDETDLTSAQFRVERFRVASLSAQITTPTEPIVAPASIPLDLDVQHLAGGGTANLPVTVRTTFYRRHNEDFGDREQPARNETRTADVTLDGSGKARLDIGDLPESKDGVSVGVEMDYRDDNGQVRTASKGFDIWPAAIRLRIEGNSSENLHPVTVAPGATPQVAAHIRARDAAGSPVAGIAVEADLLMRTRYLVDERLPGGFRTRGRVENHNVESSCSGVTNAEGIFACLIPAHLTRFDDHGNGSFKDAVLRATARDERERVTRTSARIDPRRPDDFLSVVGDGEFAPGETAPIRLSVPFEEATALVSIEREGVLDAFVVQTNGPRTINVPVKPNYAPNVKVSVLAVANRGADTGGHVPSALEVVGNRARLGLASWRPDKASTYARIEVSDEANKLDVVVEPERDSYRTRDRARVRITVRNPDNLPPRGAELALYVVDEGLLQMWPNRSAEILQYMMRWRAPDVSSRSSSDAMSESLTLPSVAEGPVGDRSYLPRGGRRLWMATDASGYVPRSIGATFRRERFDPLLLWRSRIALDDDGTAEIEVPLNDLVSAFRIVAVATAGAHLFGTGEATIRTTQDLVLHDALPPRLREGDRFQATFAVRNASDAPQRVEVVASAAGLPRLRQRTLSLAPGESHEASWRVRVPAGIDHLIWDVTAASEHASDRLGTRQVVAPAIPVRVQQATLARLDQPRDLPVASPAKAQPNRGGVAVSLRSSIAGGLDAMHEYMTAYPYTSLEGQVSTAVALNDPKRWSRVMGDLENWMDWDGLLRYFPSEDLDGSPVLTAYVLTIGDANGWTVPEYPRSRLTSGLWGFLRNNIRRHPAFPGATSRLSRLTALAALARLSVTDERMLEDFEPNLELLPTSALLDWIDTLERVVPSHPDIAAAKGILRTRLNLQGTSLGFSTDYRDQLSWLMASTDSNAARAVVTLLDEPDWQADMPRLVRGLVGRQQRGRWDTTVANAWGAVATARFAGAFEQAPVSGTSHVEMGVSKHRPGWRDTEPPARIEIPWSAAKTLTLGHEGTGAPWAFVEMRAAVPIREAAWRGYRITRTVEAEGKRHRGWRRGDVAHVELAIDADRDMTWVVVEDALPPGAVVLGSGLGGDSAMLDQSYRRDDRWPVFTERGFDSYRAYFRYVPKGRSTLRYSVRYNTAGKFRLPASRVEAMYAPEMYAELPIAPITIR